VRDHWGAIVAGVAATVPRSDIGARDEKAQLVETICAAAMELSIRLNYRPSPDDPTAVLAARKMLA
jgi:DNA-binding IclR family transcriptional regulator